MIRRTLVARAWCGGEPALSRSEALQLVDFLVERAGRLALEFHLQVNASFLLREIKYLRHLRPAKFSAVTQTVHRVAGNGTAREVDAFGVFSRRDGERVNQLHLFLFG